MQMPKTVSQVRIDAYIYEKVRVIAQAELRSVNNQIEYFLKKGVEQYELESGATISLDDFLANPDEAEQ